MSNSPETAAPANVALSSPVTAGPRCERPVDHQFPSTKSTLDDLAIFGGPPAFAERLHVGRPNIGDAERFIDRVRDVFDRRWLSNHGTYLAQLEERVVTLVGCRHAIGVANATLGLQIACRALDLTGEVIVPSFTFAATAHSLAWEGLQPVFCDVAPATHNLDPAHVVKLISPRTSAILGVHLWGLPCAIDELAGIASDHNLKLFFDAAHALGCSYRGQPIGNFGALEVFSLHATKFVNAFEGGIICTNDDALARRVRMLANFGYGEGEIPEIVGTNAKMHEASAAMGLTNLESLGEFVAVNRRNYHAYRAQLASVDGVRVIDYPEREDHNYQYVVVEIDGARATLTRDELLELLTAEKVLARRYFFPGVHRLAPYRATDGAAARLPVTERLCESVLLLPTGTTVSVADIQRVAELIRFALLHGASIRARRASEMGAAATI
ncbi:MAG: DegT/DnrJ/EryC1/StrS family aminotransferase [Pirellulales bacterium]|nr:DegT/DnrJ/EryC1/StrS family aminotransferase [Pirellulales bacterium]